MRRFLVVVCLLICPAVAHGGVLDDEPDGFRLQGEALSGLSSEEAYEKIGRVADWWSADHTYSGSAENLTLTDMAPGGSWLETWPGGAVEHGRVLATRTTDQSSMIRFDAPLGPLQDMGVRAILTLTVSTLPEPVPGRRSRIVLDYVVTGAGFQNLDTLAPFVDQVLTEQLNRLAGN